MSLIIAKLRILIPATLLFLISNSSLSAPLAISVNISYYKEQLKNPKLTPKEKASYCDSLISLLPQKEKTDYIFQKALLLGQARDYSSALAILDSLDSKAQTNTPRKCAILYYKGVYALNSHDLKESFRSSYALIDYPKPDSLKFYEAQGYLLLGSLYSLFSRYDKMEELTTTAMGIFDKMDKSSIPPDKRSMLQSQIYGCMSTSLMKQKRFEEAMKWINKSLDVSEDPEARRHLVMDLGTLYKAMGNYEKAEKIYREFIAEENSPLNTSYAIGMLCEIYNATGRSHEAIALVSQHVDLWSVIEGSTHEIGIKKDIAEAYGNIGDTEKAFSIYREIWHKRDSMDDVVDAVLFKNLEADSALRSDYHAMNALEKESSVRGWIIVGLSILILALGSLSILFLRKMKDLKKVNKDIAERSENLNADNLREIESLKDNLDISQRKAASASLRLGQLTEITNRISTLVLNKSIPANEKLNKIKDVMKDSKTSDSAWDAFITQLEQIHPSFFSNLRMLYPSLTSSEIKICGFILLNVSTKDIADLTYRSTRTIENLKYNLRKKLGITESTEAFLEKVASASKEELAEMKANQEAGARPFSDNNKEESEPEKRL